MVGCKPFTLNNLAPDNVVSDLHEEIGRRIGKPRDGFRLQTDRVQLDDPGKKLKDYGIGLFTSIRALPRGRGGVDSPTTGAAPADQDQFFDYDRFETDQQHGNIHEPSLERDADAASLSSRGDSQRQRTSAAEREIHVKNAHHYARLNSGVAKMVLARHIFRVALPQDYPTFYVRSVYASGSGPIQLVGRIGVYFAKSGGGIIIYDDVAHKWPIRLPFKKLARAGGGLKIEYVSPSVRRVTLDTSRVTKTTPLEDIAADLRSQLPPQFRDDLPALGDIAPTRAHHL